ncbi:MAG: helix-turn-helix domain-containing protein [Bacteroidetes bacterium]|nr:MAG: helix-turn-helix domain-containing protein [Bacteroidota bacterium]
MKKIPIRRIGLNQHVPELSGTFVIRDIKSLLSEKDMNQDLHRHDYFYILVLEKGKGRHDIDFISYKVCDNCVFFLRPGQVHKLNLNAGSRGYLMQFNPEFYHPLDHESRQLLRKASSKPHCQPEAKGFGRLLRLLADVFQEFTDKKEGYQEVIRAYLGIFFIELVRQKQNISNSPGKVDLYDQERLDKFLELLERNISTHKQVSEYAEMMHLSTYQLNAITKAALGKTCSTLINEAVILEAKRCLLATSNQVNQVAFQLGYEDVSYFIRFFKKHSGFSPESFRLKFK